MEKWPTGPLKWIWIFIIVLEKIVLRYRCIGTNRTGVLPCVFHFCTHLEGAHTAYMTWLQHWQVSSNSASTCTHTHWFQSQSSNVCWTTRFVLFPHHFFLVVVVGVVQLFHVRHADAFVVQARGGVQKRQRMNVPENQSNRIKTSVLTILVIVFNHQRKNIKIHV